MKGKTQVVFVFVLILILFSMTGGTPGFQINVSGSQYVVLYDMYHSFNTEGKYSKMSSQLQASFIVEFSHEIVTESRLSSCDIFVITTPITTFSTGEVYNIGKFVEEGGGLLLMGTGWYWVDYHKRPIEEYPLNQIAREFGVVINNDGVLDPTDYEPSRDPGFAIFTNFAVHPVTDGLASIHSGVVSSLSMTGSAVPIVMGDEDSYSGYHEKTYGVGEYPPIVAALEYGKGRVIIIGQDTFLSDFDLEKYSNLKFGLNIFDWLSPTVVPPTDNDNDNDGYPHPYDCNDNDASIYPGAIELCDGKDNDCNGVVDDDFDRDGDGCTTCGGDCNDNDASIYPGAIELCDGKDNDCDGAVDEDFDKDGDGYTTCGGDCNDNDASVYPGATELDDGKDNDCDGLTDEGLAEDKDHDGYSLPSDCDDNDASVHPGATELCDKKDNDCDGTVDDDFDRDGDGYTTCGGDYNDNDASIHPGAIELCDRKDNDCDGLIDEDFDKDGDGYTTCGGDYNDNDASIYPGAIELCDRKDNDCDGLIDEDFDKDGDGYTTCGGDCNDNDVNVYPGATEQDDGKDNNCNGLIDENHSEPAALFDVSPETFQRSFLVMGGVLAFVFLIFFLRRMIKHNVPEFPKTPSRDNTEDLVILSLEKRTETEYRASLESLHRTIYPVGSTRPIEISPKVRSEIISRIEYTARLVTNYSNPERSVSLEKPAEELKKMGTVIYKNFVPRDFATKLVHHYLVLEVEDVRIPWELMYSDEFFALKYAISRRIKSDKTSEIQKSKRIKKKALIIADPTGTTPEAITECDYLKKILEHYFSVTYLRAEKAGKVDVMYHLSQGYDIIHYAGELKGESCLPVYGDVLSCGEIEKNLEGSPVIFINGCGSAKTFSYDIEGLAKVFLQKGALSFIGSLWRIHDRKAAEIAADFYRNCLYYSVGESLRLSRKKNYSSEDVTWAAFVMYGDPTLDLHGRNQFR